MGLSEEIRTELIRECIKRWGDEFDDSIYDECLESVKQTELRNIANLKSTIRRFLYSWGRMERVLGRQEYANWETRLVEQIGSNCGELEEFRTKELACNDLDVFESLIKKCYESLKEVVGPIATAKTLHLICPNFFPLWDNGIADAVRKERTDRKEEEFSAADYYRFMKEVQDFAKRHEHVLSELATQHKQGKIRILDKFFWWMVHRPLSLFLTEK